MTSLHVHFFLSSSDVAITISSGSSEQLRIPRKGNGPRSGRQLGFAETRSTSDQEHSHTITNRETHTHYKMMQDELSFDGLLDMEGQGTLDQSTGGFVDGLMNSEDFTLDIKWSPDTEELSSDGAPIIEPILEAAEVFDFKPEVDSWLIQDAEVTEEREENPRVDQGETIDGKHVEAHLILNSSLYQPSSNEENESTLR